MAKTPAERQKDLRDRRKRGETLSQKAINDAVERRLRAVEDALATLNKAPTVRPPATVLAVPMNPAMAALMAKVPPKGVTPDGEIVEPARPRTWQGKPIRTCCNTVAGMPHTDLCQEIDV